MPRAPARSPAASPPTTAIAVGYLRRSTDRQEQSIPDQRRAIEAFAAEHGLRLSRFYTDDAISGTSTSERPAFQQMVADARSGGGAGGRFSRVVVYDVKRFGRIDNDEAGYYRHILRSCGVEVLYASENFSGDSTDDLLRPVKQWQARQESKDLAKVAIRGLVSKAKGGSAPHRASSDGASSSSPHSGGWMGGAPPFGYDLRYESSSGQFICTVRHQPDGSKTLLDATGRVSRTVPRGESLGMSKRDRAHLVPSDPTRTAAVREVFRLFVEEKRGPKAIADALNRANTPTARGTAWSERYGGRWCVGTIRAILNNPAYAGDLVWNRRTDARFFRISGDGHAVPRSDAPGVSRRLARNDERDWMVTKDAHEGLVSRRVFELAAQRLRERQSPPRESPRTHDMPGWAGWSSPKARFILSGLCTCARCGSRYEGHGSPHGTKSGDTPRPKVWSYVCGGYIRHGRSTCQRGAIQQHILERAVVDAVRGFHHRFEGAQGRKALGAEVDRLLLGESESNADARKRLAKRLDRIDGTVRSLLDNLSPATKAVGERRILELEHERTDCLREIAALEALDSTRREARAMADEAAAFIASMLALLARWTSAPDPSLNDAITTALRRCVSSLTLEASTRSATLELRTLPVLAAGPAFTQSHTVRLDLPASR